MNAAPYHIKKADRGRIAGGEVIAVRAVETDTSWGDSVARRLVDSSGLADADSDGLEEHSTSVKDMWLSERGRTTGSILLELEGERKVGQVRVWNYNEKYYTDRGVREADVWVWTEESDWKKVFEGQAFHAAEGTATYDEPTIIDLGGVAAVKIRLDNLKNFGDPEHVGLAKIRVHEVRGARTVLLEPAHHADSCAIEGTRLRWEPGIGATRHVVYAGTDEKELRRVIKLDDASSNTVELSGLKAATKYYWRVDSIQKDGSTARGHVRSFDTGGLVGWWKFDESSGEQAHDCSGSGRHGKLAGDAAWKADGGRFGGAIALDGDGDFVDMGRGKEFDLVAAITISCWIKVEKFDKDWQAIVTKGDTAWRVHRLQNTDSIAFHCNLWWGPGGSISVNDGKWHHVVGSYDGAKACLYIDGVLDRSEAASGLIWKNNHPVLVGENAEQRGRGWNGMIDDVRIYSFALSAEQVRMLFEGTSPEESSGGVTAKVVRK